MGENGMVYRRLLGGQRSIDFFKVLPERQLGHVLRCCLGRCLELIYVFDEQLHEARIVHGSRLCLEQVNRIFNPKRHLVWSGGANRVERVGNGKNPCAKWNFLAFETVWIATSIPTFVMVPDVLRHRKRELNLLQYLTSGGCMHLHLLEFLLAESTRLVEDIVVDGELPDVVQQ